MPSRNRDKKFWFFIEPYVQITSANGAFLFYNTLSKKRFELSQNPEAASLARQLVLPANGYVIPVTSVTLENPQVQKFVDTIRKLFMGDLIDASWSEGKPVNILPKPHVKTKLTRKTLENPEKLNAVDFGNYLHEVTIYLESGPSEVAGRYKGAERQFISPELYSRTTLTANRAALENWVNQLTLFKLATLNLAGTGISRYPGLDTIFRLGRERHFQIKLHVAVENLDEIPFDLVSSGKMNRVAFYLSFPVDLDHLNRLISKIGESGKTGWYEFHFIVTSLPELESSHEIVRQSEVPSFFFKPFFNGKNFDFFRDHIFITKQDILASRPDQNQVFSRMTINEKDFGKLTVLPDGTVYANLNDPALGNISGDSVPSMILKALMDGRSWKRSRSKVNPCRNCLYYFLCPPVSGYELLMKRFNFCDVYQKPAEP
jgi:pseudo-rSAM protein